MNTKPSYPKINIAVMGARLVSGSVAEYSTKGYKGAVLEKATCFFMVALPKNSPLAVPLLTEIQNNAWVGYNGKPGQARIAAFPIGSTPAAGMDAPFAWKIEDGDHPSNANKTGRAGCWLFKFSTTVPFQCMDENNAQIHPTSLPLGTYVDVYGDSVINGYDDKTAGVYLNPVYVRRAGYGDLIVNISAPPPEQAFGNTRAQLPAGASATPIGAPPPGSSGVAPMQMPPPPQTAAVAGVASAQPAYAPPPAPAPAAPPAQSVREPAEAVAARYGVQHHPGWRYDPQGNRYVEDTPAPAPAAPPAGNAAGVPAVPAGATAVPAPSMQAPGSQATAYPSNPPVQPHTAFVQGPPPIGGQR